MIRSLSNIRELSIIEQNIGDNLYAFNQVDFENDSIQKGNFGSIHEVLSIDSKSSSKYILKIINEDTAKAHAFEAIRLLHQKLKKRRIDTQTLPIYHEYPELLGLPFAIFKAWDDIKGEEVIAMLMYDLRQLGFAEYGGDDIANNVLEDVDVPSKLLLAYQFAKAIDLLHQLKFIHSDLKEAALFVHPERKQLVLIDYDSGFHYDKQEKPTTLGTMTSWLPDNIRQFIKKQFNIGNIPINIRIQNECWMVGNGMFELIFGVHPFFFLKDMDTSTRKKYYQKNEWPNVDYDADFFNQSATETHQSLLGGVHQFEQSGLKKLIDTFKIIFNDGYRNPTQRVRPKTWREVLFQINTDLAAKPVLHSFHSDKATINYKGEQVMFSWKAEKYNAVYLNDKLQALDVTEAFLAMKDSQKVQLKLVGDFGQIEEEITIEAIKVKPRILYFSSNLTKRESLEPIVLTWEVEDAAYVRLSNHPDKLALKGSIEVCPTKFTEYKLSAHGRFDEKETASLTVDIIKPQITKFRWEVNLNLGIKNVDLVWSTKNTTKVIISPTIGERASNGLEHIGINNKTTFKLRAIGLFTEAERTLVAYPFPVPVITHLFSQSPPINLNISVKTPFHQMPENWISQNSINVNSLVNLDELSKKFELLDTRLLNTIQDNNQDKENAPPSFSLSNLYHKIRTVVNTKQSL